MASPQNKSTIGLSVSAETKSTDETNFYQYTWYDGKCTDEEAEQQIIDNTIAALNSKTSNNFNFGKIFHQRNPLTHRDVFVTCGPQVK